MHAGSANDPAHFDELGLQQRVGGKCCKIVLYSGNEPFLGWEFEKKTHTAGITIFKKEIFFFFKSSTNDREIDGKFDYIYLRKVFKVLRRRVSQSLNDVFERLLINNFSYASVCQTLRMVHSKMHRQKLNSASVSYFIFQQLFCCKVPFICLPVYIRPEKSWQLSLTYPTLRHCLT